MRLTEKDAKSLGAAIRARREGRGLSRANLSGMIGRDPATIQGYEQGGKRVRGVWVVASPSDENLTRIAEALATTPEELFISAGLEPDAEALAAAAFQTNAVQVRATNARLGTGGLVGVTIRGEQADVNALLGLALERGLMDRLSFEAVHAA